MATRNKGPQSEIEIGDTSLQINTWYRDAGEAVLVRLDIAGAPGEGPCIGSGMTERTALRDALDVMREAAKAIEEHLENTK